jgi:hypothetical protein
MLIKLGEVVGQASGSLRSSTYSHNRYGAYIRNRAVPVNPQSARQSTVRTLMQTLTALWGSTLTAEQRAQWATYGANVAMINRLGETIHLTGLNHYLRSNVPRLVAGLDRVDDGPVVYALPETDETVTFSYTADDQKVSVAYDDTMGWADIDGAALLVYSGIPVNPTRNFFNGPFRFADSVDGDSVSPPSTPTEVDSPFTIQAAQRVYSQARITLADGRLSSFFRLGAAAVAAS